MTTKRIIAREWVIFLSSLFIGLVLTMGMFFLNPKPTAVYWYVPPFQDFLNCLTDSYYWFQTWLSVLSVYILVQLVRSVLWSIRMLKSKDAQ